MINLTCLSIVVLLLIIGALVWKHTNSWEMLGILLSILSIWSLILLFSGIDIFDWAWENLWGLGQRLWLLLTELGNWSVTIWGVWGMTAWGDIG